MKKTYPPREREPMRFLILTCECGHLEDEHDYGKYYPLSSRGKCQECMCPKYKYDAEQSLT